MKKQELLKIMDDVLLEKLFGFCYARTNASYEAQDLCSDIVFALVKAANTTGDITDIYPFIWRTARNVYADFCKSRKRHAEIHYQGDPADILTLIQAEENDDNSEELLQKVYYQISFLSKVYREVMILYYLNGLPTAEIAKQQNLSETAVRQRLFSARKKVKKEVENMTDIHNKPIALDTIDFTLYGWGNPLWSDPRNGVDALQQMREINDKASIIMLFFLLLFTVNLISYLSPSPDPYGTVVLCGKYQIHILYTHQNSRVQT